MASPPDSGRVDTLKRELDVAKVSIVKDVQALVDQRLTNYVAAYDDVMRRRERQLNDFERILEQKEHKFQWERDNLRKDRDEFEAVKCATLQIAHIQPEIVEIVVGGKRFETTPLTLLRCNDCTLAVALLNMNRFNPGKDRITIDRDPTHFEKILNFLRDENSLVWLQQPNLSIADIKEVKLEAEYYKLKPLVRVLSWEVISRESPAVTDFEACGFRTMRGTRPGSSQMVVVYKTTQNLDLRNMNFESVRFASVYFNHPTQFNGSLLKGAVFTGCQFNAAVDFTDVNMTGAKFLGCHGLLTPDQAFLLDGAKGTACIPQQW